MNDAQSTTDSADEPKCPSGANPPTQFEGASYDRHADAMTQSSQASLRNVMLINGGACVAIMGFIGATLNAPTPNGPIPTIGLAFALLIFAAGVLLGAIASGLNFLHVRTRALVSSGHRTVANPRATSETKRQFAPQIADATSEEHQQLKATVVLVILAYFCFALGSVVTFCSIM